MATVGHCGVSDGCQGRYHECTSWAHVASSAETVTHRGPTVTHRGPTVTPAGRPLECSCSLQSQTSQEVDAGIRNGFFHGSSYNVVHKFVLLWTVLEPHRLDVGKGLKDTRSDGALHCHVQGGSKQSRNDGEPIGSKLRHRRGCYRDSARRRFCPGLTQSPDPSNRRRLPAVNALLAEIQSSSVVYAPHETPLKRQMR